MTDWKPTDEHVMAAWQNFLRSGMRWDFQRQGELKLPLPPPAPRPQMHPPLGRVFQETYWYCIVDVEYGEHPRWGRGFRIVGRVADLNIEVVLQDWQPT